MKYIQVNPRHIFNPNKYYGVKKEGHLPGLTRFMKGIERNSKMLNIQMLTQEQERFQIQLKWNKTKINRLRF